MGDGEPDGGSIFKEERVIVSTFAIRQVGKRSCARTEIMTGVITYGYLRSVGLPHTAALVEVATDHNFAGWKLYHIRCTAS